MFVTSLKYKITEASSARLLRFHTGSSRLRTVYFFNGSDEESSEIVNALFFCLGIQSQLDFDQVILDLADDSGVRWTVAKSPIRTEFFKNGQRLQQTEMKDSLLASMLDLDLQHDRQHDMRSLEAYNLSFFKQQLYLKKVSSGVGFGKAQGDFAAQAELGYHALLSRLNRATLVAPKEIIGFYQAILPIVQEMRILKATATSLRHHITQPDALASANKIFQELALIAQIDSLTKDLESNLETARQQNQQIQQAEAESHQYQQHEHMEALHKSLPWQTIIESLSRLTLHEKLATDLEKINQEHLNPVDKQHRELCSQLTSLQRDIKKLELLIENSVSELSTRIQQRQLFISEQTQLRKSFQDKEPGEVFLKWAQKLLPMRSHSEATPSTERDPGVDSEIHEMESLKLAFGKAAKMAETLSRFAGSDAQRPQIVLRDLFKKYEKATREYAKVKSDWSQVANDYGLPQTMTLEDIEAYLNYFAHQQQRLYLQTQLDGTIAQTRQTQTSLLRLVQQWRDSTHSVRQQKLDGVAALLAEAKGISRFRFEKEKLLHKYNETHAREKLPSVMEAYLSEQMNNCQTRFAKLLENFGLPPMAAESVEFNSLLSQLEEFKVMCSHFDCDEWVQGWSSVSQWSDEAPLQVISWSQLPLIGNNGSSSGSDSASAQSKDLERLAVFLQQLKYSGCMLFLSDSTSLQKIAHKLGAGKVQYIKAETSAGGALRQNQASENAAASSMQMTAFAANTGSLANTAVANSANTVLNTSASTAAKSAARNAANATSAKKLISSKAEEALKILNSKPTQEGLKR